MNRREHLLFIASEECDETGQRCSKAARFGFWQVQPGQELTNAQRIEAEFLDIVAAMEMLAAEGMILDPISLISSDAGRAAISRKRAAVEFYLEEVSHPNGTYQP